MKFGFVMPFGDARQAADFALAAEESGWDGFFVWEPVWGVDAWIALTAAAMQTKRIRLGTMISPISRMRPWKLASETATLDNLSGGRVILSVGLGATGTGFEAFGEVTDRKLRAELVDESLEILVGLWKGQPFRFSGKHYKVKETDFQLPAAPIQKPKIPIWVVGAWPRMKSMQRAIRYDGILPNIMDGKEVRMGTATPEELLEMNRWIWANRKSTTGFDVIVEGATPGEDPSAGAEIVRGYEQAGATWWIEAKWNEEDRAGVLQRIRQGPPRVE